jgi:glycosyltransferase involved in cell wall biosynthesis
MPHPDNKPAISRQPISMALVIRNQAALVDRALPAWVTALSKLDRPFEILAVDDGSSDESVRRAQIVASSHPEVQVLSSGQVHGFGAALRAAIDKARYPLFFYTALDYPYQTSDLRKLLDRIDDVDFVSGYRTAVPPPLWLQRTRRVLDLTLRILIGLQREPQPGWLGWKLHSYARFVRLLFGVHLVDVESAFKLFRRELLASVPIQSDGPFVHTEIVAKLNFRGCWMDELPIGAQGGVPREALAIPFRMRDRWQDLRRLLSRSTFVKPAAAPPADPSPAPTPAAI